MAPPYSASILRSVSMLRSNTVTWAPMPQATAAALSPATPPPMTTTSAGATPGTPPISTPRPPLAAHQVVGADLGRQPAGDLAHRGQQRQRAVGGLHGLVGDRGGARGQQRVGARPATPPGAGR